MKPYKRFPPEAPGYLTLWIWGAFLTVILAIVIGAKILGAVTS